MKALKHLFLAALLAGLASATTVRADEKKHNHHDQAGASAKDAKAKPYPLAFCLVSDEKFEGSDMKPVELIHEGQTIKFCCKNCVKDFKKDPNKFLTKLADEVKKQEEAKAKK
jgi:hypothetical protein